jgi:hypothetical protein
LSVDDSRNSQRGGAGNRSADRNGADQGKHRQRYAGSGGTGNSRHHGGSRRQHNNRRDERRG